MQNFHCALVTGASSGIGRELCFLLAKKGIDLMLVARSAYKLEELADELRSLVNVDVIVADLSLKDQRQTVIHKLYDVLPDLVINNAGWGYYGEALTYETDVSMNMLEVDVSALMEITLESARALVSSGKKGVIMNISSSAAMQVFPCFSVYAACKSFVNIFSESFDEEMRPYGIHVLASCPGMVDTNFRYRASGDENQKPHRLSMSVEFAAQEIWKQIQSKKPVHFFDWKYRVASFFSHYFLPKRWISRYVRKSIEDRHPKREIIKRTK